MDLTVTNMGEYHDFYLATDVYLLADVFENFRDMCLDYYGLEPTHYYTLPMLAWGALLNYTSSLMLKLHGALAPV